jgi:hypothetical protein
VSKQPDTAKRSPLPTDGELAHHRLSESVPHSKIDQRVGAHGTQEVLKLAELLGRRAARRKYRSKGSAVVLDGLALALACLIVGTLLMLCFLWTF